ncbi:MAG TPA: 4a-hydroxytetrahydrobiopterin dehydratase [Candidatus Salinicoccus stercoripullorum]|uniref:4a-hydroxytetrahydrobiopterin dehydratase n=1 Tax=Candidatus Salinicoccus stercoripullorum TaxID=2838756 RepID=A0A9D1QGA5_9STAP|nr:4a-hydroxytetrahydrobiopterin dehydratase [Candidatus Salinicoccus stercoripullorum]
MEDVKTQAENMDGWSLENEIIIRKFKFDKYLDGVSFAEKIGIYAESVQHHPFISIDYTAVTVSWTTHSKNSLTEKDIAAARACNNLYRLFT